MHDTLPNHHHHHFLSNSATTKSSLFPPPKKPHHDLPHNSLHFPSLSSKTNTISLPPKPPISPTTPLPKQLPPLPPNAEADFQEKMLYLDSLGLDIFLLMDQHRPVVLSSSIAGVKSVVAYLSSMGFTAQDFQRFVSMCPEILASSSDADIVPVFTFLLRETRVKGTDLRRIINRRPRLLVSSVKRRLRPTLYFLQSIGIAEVNKHTYLLSCSVEEKLVPRILYFQKIGFSYKDSVSMFRRFPQLFNYSVKENIEPKLNYFVVEMGRDLKELKEFPQYFSFSLENRIKPRHKFCVEKDVYFPLRPLLKTSEAKFRERLEVCCNSSKPFSSSPLSRVNFHTDLNTG